MRIQHRGHRRILSVLMLGLSAGLLGRSAAAGECTPQTDIDGDGVVEVDDLLAVIGQWGASGGPEDLDGDGLVEVDDLLIVIGCWGETFPTQQNVVAMNLGPVRDWTAQTFSDVFKQSRTGWFTTDNVMGGEFDTGYADQMVGEDGWPNVGIPFDPDGAGPIPAQRLHTLMSRDLWWGPGGPFAPVSTDLHHRFPAGDYTLTFEGTGVIELSGSGAPITPFIGAGPHTFTITDPNNIGIILKIVESFASDPVRNIQLRQPGYSIDDSENLYGPFTNEFVEALQPFTAVRFMGWAQTNDHPCTNGVEDPRSPACLHEWDGRTLPTDRSQGGSRGCSIEYMIELCNIAEIDPWLVIPHAATDDYIEQLALLVATNLDSDRKVYLEYSNEVWNPLYDAFHYADAMGQGLGEQPVFAWQAKRSGDIFCAFKDIGNFSDDDLVTMMCAQFNNSWTGERVISFFNDPTVNPNTCNAELDAIGIGPYFGDNDEHVAVESDSVDDIYDKVYKSIHTGRYFTRTLEYKALADDFGLRVIAYEGGQHLVMSDDNSSLQDKFAELNRDPRMKDLYHAAWQVWVDNTGGDVYAYANLIERMSRWGFWGHLEYDSQKLYEFDDDGLRPYKMEALIEIINGTR